MRAGNGRCPGKPASTVDLELFTHIQDRLYTAVVCDSLDELGYRDQAMREDLRPLLQDRCFAGWARTILCMDLHYTPMDTYDTEIEAIDSILPGEVVVAATGQSRRNAPWGELLSTAALGRGARGAVVDGLVRDVKKIRELGFPVFAAGIKPVDSKGRGIVVDYNVPVECGGVTTYPGDLVFADADGVVVIPVAVVGDVVCLATEKVQRENNSRDELLRGAHLREVFSRHGVL